MIAVANNVAVLIIFAIIGWLLCKGGILNEQNAKTLSVLEVWLFLPCKMFKSFSSNFTAEYISEKYSLVIVSVILLAVIAFLTWLLVPKFVKDKKEQSICRYSLMMGNYGYVGYALAESVYGATALLDMMIFAIPVSLFVYTEGYRMLTGGEKISLKRIINPVLMAIIPGIIFGLAKINVPDVFMNVINSASACMSPVSMILAGMLVSSFSLKELVSDVRVYIISVLRLVIIPASICFILSSFCSDAVVISALLVYSMPCGMNTVIFCNIAGNDSKLGVALPFVSTVLALLTIPIMCKGVEIICSL